MFAWSEVLGELLFTHGALEVLDVEVLFNYDPHKVHLEFVGKF